MTAPAPYRETIARLNGVAAELRAAMNAGQRTIGQSCPPKGKAVSEKLYVVCCVSNPLGWRSRTELARKAITSWIEHGADVTLVEAAFGSRPHELDELADIGVHLVKVRATTLAWNKESLLNIGIQRLPDEARKVATIDADVIWRNPRWVEQTIRALDIYHVVQPWGECFDLGPSGDHMQVHHSFAKQYAQRAPLTGGKDTWANYGYPHPGFAWAWQRDFLDRVGGLFDVAGMGSGDHHMALGLVGKAQDSLPGGSHPNYVHAVMRWADRARLHLNGKLGYLPMTIEHFFHGAKPKRDYMGRWDYFLKHQFDPAVHLKRNSYGVVEFSGSHPELERDFDAYLRQRDEDANSL